ncbi:MAG: YbjN domain-containing protein, partial [Bacteroidia bacterium]|nr:YbjN domain-containing protein [Bacteroidia bacterium]
LNDPDIDNVQIKESGQGLDFEIIQGSKKLVGLLRQNSIRVQSKVAKIKQMEEKLLRHLLEYNFELRYSRFGITDDDHISIIFDSSTDDGSPYKLYYALKEVANHSDKQDDLLIYQYTTVEHIDKSLFNHIQPNQKTIKYKYLISSIHNCRAYIENHTDLVKNYSGGIAYLLLSLAYKLDFLIKPEGYLMDRLEEINAIYFNNNIPDPSCKINHIQNEYELILERPESSLKEEMYWVKSTFGITTPVNHDRISNFIEGELNNMDWYVENDYHTIAESIPGYIVGYALFHFAPPKPDLEYLQFYYRIIETEFYSNLGFKNLYYNPKKRSFNRKEIKKYLKSIVRRNYEMYPYLNPNLSSLRFGSKSEFARSYLRMIQNLDMTRNE